MESAVPLVRRNWALFLDVDGTLLDYVARPDMARVTPALRETLGGLRAALDGAVSVISGRAIADLNGLFAPLRLPMAGQHGAELWLNESRHVEAHPSTELASILAPVYAYAKKHQGIYVEDKGASVAFHYRGVEDKRDTLRALLKEAVAHSARAYNLLDSHLAFDIRPNGANKGHAVDWFMATPPFAGRIPVFAGDDNTDEDGFAAALALHGHAIKVGDRVPSIAPWNFHNPAAFRNWLERSAAALAAVQ
jgi:trehalose 6-phosphate phosphatase